MVNSYKVSKKVKLVPKDVSDHIQQASSPLSNVAIKETLQPTKLLLGATQSEMTYKLLKGDSKHNE